MRLPLRPARGGRRPPGAPLATSGAVRAPRVPRRARLALLTAGAVCLVAAAPPGPAVPRGVGDRLFPQLGNPGYDVRSYDIRLAYRGADRPLDAETRIVARATRRLAAVNLDFTGGAVRSVEVNGAHARHTTAGEDLVLSPARPVPAGGTLRITVRHTSVPGPAGDRRGGWVRTADGLVMANQADAAHRVFPCNDHPSDKARFTFRIDAPDSLTVVANGRLAGRVLHGSRTAWTYRESLPMATELAQVSIGRSAVPHRAGPHGLPLRDVVPAADRAALEPWLARTPEQIRWLEDRLGPFPFPTYGVLVAAATTGFELETQTLSLFEEDLFTSGGRPDWSIESIMVHELAHQWLGDSVAPAAWSDLWLNEGHATWYETLYGQAHGGTTLDERMRAAYRASDAMRAQDGPPARPKRPDPDDKISIFRPVVYDGAALALYALRQRIGGPAFARLERAWVRTHRYGNATTGDFVRLASAVAGRDVAGFLRPWLYGTTTPPMPGHPEWKKADPRRAPTTRARRAARAPYPVWAGKKR